MTQELESKQLQAVLDAHLSLGRSKPKMQQQAAQTHLNVATQAMTHQQKMQQQQKKYINKFSNLKKKENKCQQ